MTQIYALSGSHGAKAQLSFVGTGHAVAVTGRRGPAGEPALPGEALLGGGVRGEGEPQTLPTALRTGLGACGEQVPCLRGGRRWG